MAFTLNDETVKFEQYGSFHKQMGYDTRGRMVWPDSSIHDMNPNYVMLYALPTTDFDDAKNLTKAMLEHFNTPQKDAWMPVIPPTGRERIPSLSFSYAEAEHVVSNRINPVHQMGEKDE